MGAKYSSWYNELFILIGFIIRRESSRETMWNMEVFSAATGNGESWRMSWEQRPFHPGKRPKLSWGRQGPLTSPDVLRRAIWSVCRHGKSQGSSRVNRSQNKSLVETGNTCCSSCCSRCAAAGKRILEEQLPMILSVVFIKPKKTSPRFLNGSQKRESWTLGCWCAGTLLKCFLSRHYKHSNWGLRW